MADGNQPGQGGGNGNTNNKGKGDGPDQLNPANLSGLAGNTGSGGAMQTDKTGDMPTAAEVKRMMESMAEMKAKLEMKEKELEDEKKFRHEAQYEANMLQLELSKVNTVKFKRNPNASPNAGSVFESPTQAVNPKVISKALGFEVVSTSVDTPGVQEQNAMIKNEIAQYFKSRYPAACEFEYVLKATEESTDVKTAKKFIDHIGGVNLPTHLK